MTPSSQNSKLLNNRFIIGKTPCHKPVRFRNRLCQQPAHNATKAAGVHADKAITVKKTTVSGQRRWLFMCLKCRDRLRTAVHKTRRHWSSDPRGVFRRAGGNTWCARIAAVSRLPTETYGSDPSETCKHNCLTSDVHKHRKRDGAQGPVSLQMNSTTEILSVEGRFLRPPFSLAVNRAGFRQSPGLCDRCSCGRKHRNSPQTETSDLLQPIQSQHQE